MIPAAHSHTHIQKKKLKAWLVLHVQKMLWCQNDAIVAETSKRGFIPYKSTRVCNTFKLLSEHCVSTGMSKYLLK